MIPLARARVLVLDLAHLRVLEAAMQAVRDTGSENTNRRNPMKKIPKMVSSSMVRGSSGCV